MAIRPIDGAELLGIERLLDTDVVRKSKTASWLLDQVLHDIQAMPTLTPPNEPLTLEQLRWMDGEPVWYGFLKKWALVSIRDAEVWLVTLWNEYVIRADDCENTGTMVYRRPPEEEGI